MKNMRLLLSLFVLVIPLFLVTACIDKDEGPQPDNRKELLTARPWKMKKVLANDIINITDYPEVAVFKDAQVKFEEDGTYTATRGTETQTGTWAFADNETKLVLNAGTEYEVILEIASLRDNDAKFRTTQDVPNFGRVEFTLEAEYAVGTIS
jgi:hypothetical protein